MAPSQSLLSILTEEQWQHNDMTSFIRFRPDGTGDVGINKTTEPLYS
jgi:hypothetical protein